MKMVIDLYPNEKTDILYNVLFFSWDSTILKIKLPFDTKVYKSEHICGFQVYEDL